MFARIVILLIMFAEFAILEMPNDLNIMRQVCGQEITDYKQIYLKKLLEFSTTSEHREALLADALVRSLGRAESSPEQQTSPHPVSAVDLIYGGAVDNLRFERTSKALSHIDSLKQTERDVTTSFRSRAIQTELNSMILDLQKQSAEIAFERRRLRLASRLAAIQEETISPLQAATGNQQNFLINAMSKRVLEYGYSTIPSGPMGETLNNITLSDEDLSRIRLKILTRNGWVEFPLLKGAGALEQPPYMLREFELDTQVASITNQLDRIAQLTGQEQEFVSEVRGLRDRIEALEMAVEQELGKAHEAARRGADYYRKWRQVKDYLTGLYALLNSIELQNSPQILSSRFKYDVQQLGNGILPLTTFVVTNSCQFAPALPGDEYVYVKLHQALLQLHVLLSE